MPLMLVVVIVIVERRPISLPHFDAQIDVSLALPEKCPSIYYKFKFNCSILPCFLYDLRNF